MEKEILTVVGLFALWGISIYGLSVAVIEFMKWFNIRGEIKRRWSQIWTIIAMIVIVYGLGIWLIEILKMDNQYVWEFPVIVIALTIFVSAIIGSFIAQKFKKRIEN